MQVSTFSTRFENMEIINRMN